MTMPAGRASLKMPSLAPMVKMRSLLRDKEYSSASPSVSVASTGPIAVPSGMFSGTSSEYNAWAKVGGSFTLSTVRATDVVSVAIPSVTTIVSENEVSSS